MRPINTLIVCLATILCLANPRDASAVPIKYVVQGVGSGEVGLAPFTNQPFTFTMYANTDNVQNGPFYIAVNNDSIALDLLGNTYTGFAGSSYVFPQPNFPVLAGFTFVQALVGTDWDSGQLNAYHPAFQTYDLKTEVGPLTLPTTTPAAPNPLGLFLIPDNGPGLSIQQMSQATFQAIYVPEPSALLGWACWASGMLTLRRRAGAP